MNDKIRGGLVFVNRFAMVEIQGVLMPHLFWLLLIVPRHNFGTGMGCALKEVELLQ